MDPLPFISISATKFTKSRYEDTHIQKSATDPFKHLEVYSNYTFSESLENIVPSLAPLCRLTFP